MNAKVTIKKRSGEKVVVSPVAVTRDSSEAQKITDAALALERIDLADVKIAEYTLDDQHVFAYLRQADGLHILTPQGQRSA